MIPQHHRGSWAEVGVAKVGVRTSGGGAEPSIPCAILLVSSCLYFCFSLSTEQLSPAQRPLWLPDHSPPTPLLAWTSGSSLFVLGWPIPNPHPAPPTPHLLFSSRRSPLAQPRHHPHHEECIRPQILLIRLWAEGQRSRRLGILRERLPVKSLRRYGFRNER